MIKFIVCEDDPQAQKNIQVCIQSTMEMLENSLWGSAACYDICCYAQYTENLAEKIKSNFAKIYIIDLELKGSFNGFDIARMIRDDDQTSAIIILTVYDGFQGEAFKRRLKIMDYITKNADSYLRLKETIILALKEIRQTYLFIQGGNKALSVKFMDIIYIHRITKERKSQITLNNGKIFKTSLTLDQLSLKLDYRFFRTHQSYLINLDYIDSISFDNETILFKTGLTLPCLSRQRKKELREFIKAHWKGNIPS